MPKLTVQLTAARRHLSLSGAFVGTRLEIIQNLFAKTPDPRPLPLALPFGQNPLILFMIFRKHCTLVTVIPPKPNPHWANIRAARISIDCCSDFAVFFLATYREQIVSAWLMTRSHTHQTSRSTPPPTINLKQSPKCTVSNWHSLLASCLA